MTTRTSIAALVVGLALVAPACGDDGRDVPPEAKAFCAEMDELGGDRGNGYDGSDQQVADVETLLEVAPEAVRADLEQYRDALVARQAAGADPAAADPAVDVAEVQAHIDAVEDYGSSTC